MRSARGVGSMPFRRAHEEIVLEHVPQTRQSVTDRRLTYPEPLSGSRKGLRMHDRVKDDQKI